MCIAFHPQFLNPLRSLWTQRIVARWQSSDASLKNLGILKNEESEKGLNFGVFSTLEQCLSAFYDVASFKGRPLSILPSHWETASWESAFVLPLLFYFCNTFFLYFIIHTENRYTYTNKTTYNIQPHSPPPPTSRSTKKFCYLSSATKLSIRKIHK